MRIVLADHQSKVRFALHMLLRRQPGLEVVGEADNVENLLARVASARPDLLLLHWRLGEEMPQLLATLKRDYPELKIIVLSVQLEARPHALAAGAEAFVCKMDPPEKLLAAVNRVRDGCRQEHRERSQPRQKKLAGSPKQASAGEIPEEKSGLKILGLKGGDLEIVPHSGT